MLRRTKAVAISKQVKKAVYDRDREKCVWCGRYVPQDCASAHYIPRSQGGLGIEQNILTLCGDCHSEYDNGKHREKMKEYFRNYLEAEYGVIDERDLVYTKWGIFE